MGVGLVGNTVRRPACVSNADRASEWAVRERSLQIDQLAFGTTSIEASVVERGHAS